MDGEDHYRAAMNLLEIAADPAPHQEEREREQLLAADAHLTAALIHATNPELAREWSTP